VVKELTEDLLTVFGVRLSVEDVVVPHRVDVRCWDDVRVEDRGVEEQEATVAGLDVVDLVLVPTLTLFLVHQLHLDHREVERCDGLLGVVE